MRVTSRAVKEPIVIEFGYVHLAAASAVHSKIECIFITGIYIDYSNGMNISI